MRRSPPFPRPVSRNQDSSDGTRDGVPHKRGQDRSTSSLSPLAIEFAPIVRTPQDAFSAAPRATLGRDERLFLKGKPCRLEKEWTRRREETLLPRRYRKAHPLSEEPVCHRPSPRSGDHARSAPGTSPETRGGACGAARRPPDRGGL